MPLDLVEVAWNSFGCIIGVALGYWMYRRPWLFAHWFWIKRYFPVSENDHIPPARFVSFFRIYGLISVWAGAAMLVLSWILYFAGYWEPTKPPAI